MDILREGGVGEIEVREGTRANGCTSRDGQQCHQDGEWGRGDCGAGRQQR